jgi:hypothetical protein
MVSWKKALVLVFIVFIVFHVKNKACLTIIVGYLRKGLFALLTDACLFITACEYTSTQCTNCGSVSRGFWFSTSSSQCGRMFYIYFLVVV